MMDDLENLAKEDQTEESDAAPISSMADHVTEEEQKAAEEKKRQKKFLKTVQAISSASETDEKTSNMGSESDTNSVTKRKRPSRLKKDQSKNSSKLPLEPVAEKVTKKPKFENFKGIRIQSDTEEPPFKSAV